MKVSKYNVITKMNKDNYILCNILYKSIISYKKDEHEKILLGLKGISKFPEINKILFDNNFVINDEVNEEEIIINFMKKRILNENTLNLTIFSTLDCNFKCVYCYQNHIKESNLSSENINYIIKFIERKINSKNNINLSWFGGEPLMNFKNIEKLNSYLIKKYPKKRFISSIITNGYLLSEKISDKLIRDLKVRNFQITLDGNKSSHNKRRFLKNNKNIDTFNQILNNLIYILKKYKDNVFVNLRINIYSQMSENDLDFLFYLSEFKNNIFVSLNPIHNNPGENPGLNENSSKIIKKIINLYKYVKKLGFSTKEWFYENKYNSCTSGMKNSYFILPNREQIICTGVDFEKNNIIGQINKNGIIETYSGRNNFNKNIDIDDECLNCKVLPICLQGCDYIRNIKNKKVCIPQKYYLDEYVKLLF
ncbi:radical SAM/SPASM domain-containing protein [Geotoga petraea]|uniref:Radical SAM core domain-containing protein n=1 Tax=Geotoga petraea TaxID=28234 RepID=A0A1G6P3S4_9BACT|nr:radical SAM protein [Geotoga petraea]SDC74087.1 uncharacterized protein SAMN04488588_1695 [Geotoga petraea]